MATLLLAIVCMFAVPIGAQAQQKSQIRIEFKKASLADVLKKLQKTSGYQILFTYEDVKTFTVEGPIVAKNIDDALQKILGDKPFAYTVDGKYVSVLLSEKIEKKPPVQRQKTYKITGQVMDTEMGTLPGASIAVEGTDIQIVADNNGMFTLNLPVGEKSTVVVSYIGMKPARRTFDGRGAIRATFTYRCARTPSCRKWLSRVCSTAARTASPAPQPHSPRTTCWRWATRTS